MIVPPRTGTVRGFFFNISDITVVKNYLCADDIKSISIFCVNFPIVPCTTLHRYRNIRLPVRMTYRLQIINDITIKDSQESTMATGFQRTNNIESQLGI